LAWERRDKSTEVEKTGAADIEACGCIIGNQILLEHNYFLVNVAAYIL
jgi:hypothetical protein